MAVFSPEALGRFSFFLLLGCLLFAGPTLAQKAPPVTQVRIEGLTGLTEEEVLERLGGRLDFVTSRPPSRSRADDADFLVRSLLEKEGYTDIDISWKIPADRRSIILRISSGPRLTIKEVKIQGVRGDDGETMQKYFTGKSLLGTEAVVPYLPDQVEDAAKNAVTYLKAQGYWAATGDLSPPAINPTSRTVDLEFRAKPGPLHTVSQVAVTGTIPPELPKLPRRLARYQGRTATADLLREIREGTAAQMRDEGYQFAKTSLEATHQNGKTSLILNLEPGQQYRLRQTEIIGPEKMDISRVQKLFARSQDKPYDEDSITRLRNILLGTGAFDSIEKKRIIDEQNRAIDVTLHLKEGEPKGITGYLGAGTLEGLIVGASYYDRNFLRKLYNLNIAAEFSAIGFLGEVSVTDPFVMGYDLRATPRAFALARTFDEYNKFEIGLGLTLSYEFSPRQSLQADAQISVATVRREDLPTAALGQTDYFLATLGATWLYDSRQSRVSPSKGFFARARAEIGAVSADVPNAFVRLEGQAAYHLPLNDESRLAFNLRTGVLAPSDGEELPVDLRYFIGGADSIRSVPLRQFGPQAGGAARGGQAFWYANVEYIRQIAGPLYGVAFVDVGSMEETATAWPSFEPQFAAGVGLRLDLPIGPIRFEYGHALNPDEGDPNGAFHFAIGAPF